jgi:uncharacterized membrane protein
MSTSSTVVLVLAVFGASMVEMVEALTIVVAAGVTRSWRSSLEGAAAAVAVLAVIVLAVGVPLIHYVPIDALRVVVGALLLVLGLSWLRKSILRASGHKALHDEDAIFAATSAELAPAASSSPSPKRRDAISFSVAFKGVFLEGMEVVLIVVSLGASQHRLGIAAVAAVAAALVVAAVGALVAKQLSQVPENTIKLVVGIMLTSFGLFWVGEGAGAHWPGSDAAIIVLIGVFSLVTIGSIAWLRTLHPTVRGQRTDVGLSERVEE